MRWEVAGVRAARQGCQDVRLRVRAGARRYREVLDNIEARIQRAYRGREPSALIPRMTPSSDLDDLVSPKARYVAAPPALLTVLISVHRLIVFLPRSGCPLDVLGYSSAKSLRHRHEQRLQYGLCGRGARQGMQSLFGACQVRQT